MIFFEISSHGDLKQAFRSILTVFVLLYTIQIPPALGVADGSFVPGSHHQQKLSHSGFVKIRKNFIENQYSQNLLARAQSSSSASIASIVSTSSTSATSGSNTGSSSASSVSSTSTDSQSTSSIVTTSLAATTTSSTSTTTTDAVTTNSTTASTTTTQSTTARTKSQASTTQSTTSTTSLVYIATQTVLPATSVSSSISSSAGETSLASSSFLSKVFSHSNKFFPVAIAVTVLIGISFILFILGLIQCISRKRFMKKEAKKNQGEMNEKFNNEENSEEPTRANANETLFQRPPPAIEPKLRPVPSFRGPYVAARGRVDREMMNPHFPSSQYPINGNRVPESQEHNRFRNGPEFTQPYPSMPPQIPQAILNTYPDSAARRTSHSAPAQNSDFVPNGLSSFEPRRMSRPLPGLVSQASIVPSKYPYGQLPLPPFAPGGNDFRYGTTRSIAPDTSPRGSGEEYRHDRGSYSSTDLLIRTSGGNLRAPERPRGESRNSTLRYGY